MYSVFRFDFLYIHFLKSSLLVRQVFLNTDNTRMSKTRVILIFMLVFISIFIFYFYFLIFIYFLLFFNSFILSSRYEL